MYIFRGFPFFRRYVGQHWVILFVVAIRNHAILFNKVFYSPVRCNHAALAVFPVLEKSCGMVELCGFHQIGGAGDRRFIWIACISLSAPDV